MKLSVDSEFSNVFYGKKRKPGNPTLALTTRKANNNNSK